MHEAHVADGPLPQQREGGQVGLAREPCRGSGTDRGPSGRCGADLLDGQRWPDAGALRAAVDYVASWRPTLDQA